MVEGRVTSVRPRPNGLGIVIEVTFPSGGRRRERVVTVPVMPETLQAIATAAWNAESIMDAAMLAAAKLKNMRKLQECRECPEHEIDILSTRCPQCGGANLGVYWTER